MKIEDKPEMAMANPQPPPHMSFHEFLPPIRSDNRTGVGDSIGDFSGEVPGR